MILTKTEVNDYMNMYHLSERIPFHTTATKLYIYNRPPTIKEEVISTSTNRWFLFESKTRVTREVLVDNTIRKQKCFITPEMQEMINKITFELSKMNPDIYVVSGQNVSGPNKDKLLEGQQIIVVPRIVETCEKPFLWGKNKYIAFINWKLLPQPEPSAPC